MKLNSARSTCGARGEQGGGRGAAGTGRVTETPYYWGVHEDVYCAGKEGTFQFLEDVLTEVMAIFPCTYLHIGGDEVRLAALLSLPFAHHCRQGGKSLVYLLHRGVFCGNFPPDAWLHCMTPSPLRLEALGPPARLALLAPCTRI